MYINLGDLELAKCAYKSALALMPDNVEVLNNMAVIAWREGRVDVAINFGEKGFRVGASFEGCYNLALWYF